MAKTLMGKLLNQMRFERGQARARAQEALWKRNGMENPTTRANHKIEEVRSVTDDGKEVTSYHIWKMLDTEVIQLGATVNTEVIKEAVEEDWLAT